MQRKNRSLPSLLCKRDFLAKEDCSGRYPSRNWSSSSSSSMHRSRVPDLPMEALALAFQCLGLHLSPPCSTPPGPPGSLRSLARTLDAHAIADKNRWKIYGKGIDQDLQGPENINTLRCLLFPHSVLTSSRLVAAVLPEVEQLAKAVETASALQEVVAHELGCAGATLDVNAETNG